jgi:uncharacterized protein with HEPN domain
MKREALKYLLDILPAVNDIEIFMTNVPDFSSYQKDKLVKAGVERKLLIIGEAVNKFRTLEPEIAVENADKIYGLRNRLAHAYDSVDDTAIYVIVRNHLPLLRKQVEEIIEKNKD